MVPLGVPPLPGRHRAQAGHGDGEEPPHGRLGGQASGGGQGVQALAGEFAGCDVGPDGISLGGRREQVGDHVLELLPRPGHVVAAVQQGHGQFGVVALMMLDQCERGEDGFEVTWRRPAAGVWQDGDG